MFRLMKSDDKKSKMHLNMWLGPVLSDVWVGPAIVDEGLDYEHFNLVAEICNGDEVKSTRQYRGLASPNKLCWVC